MKIDEEALKATIKDDMESTHKRFLINTLRYCYNHEVEDLDSAEKQFDIARGEAKVASGSFSDVFEHIQWELKNKGRQFVLTAVLSNVFQFIGYERRHTMLTLIEISEVEEHVEERRPMEAIMRLCSYLDNLLEEENDGDSGSLYYRIQTAADEDFFTEQEEKLAQFIRDVRNDAGHNFWVETEMSYAIHDLAAIVSITLLDRILRKKGITSWPVQSQIGIGSALRVVESEFGFIWDSDEREWDDGPREKYEHIVEWEDPV